MREGAASEIRRGMKVAGHPATDGSRFVLSHPSRDKAARRMGHPYVVAWKKGETVGRVGRPPGKGCDKTGLPRSVLSPVPKS
jgi:hypothetical protein